MSESKRLLPSKAVTLSQRNKKLHCFYFLLQLPFKKELFTNG